MATQQNNPGGNNPQQGQKSGAGKGWLYMIPIIVVGIIIVKFLFPSPENSGKKDSNDNNTKAQTEQTYHGHEPIHVTYGPGPDYGDIIYIPSGFDYYFKNATEPYCYCNANGSFNCGEKGEDATGSLGNGPQNKKLRFRSTSSKKGKLDIILIKK